MIHTKNVVKEFQKLNMGKLSQLPMKHKTMFPHFQFTPPEIGYIFVMPVMYGKFIK